MSGESAAGPVTWPQVIAQFVPLYREGLGMFDQLPQQRIVIGVRHLRVVEDVIAVVGLVELFPQSGRALSGAWHRHAWVRTPGSRTHPGR